MKKLKTLLVAAMLMIGLSTFAQTNAKVIAIVNKADWCSICKAYGGRTVAAFTENNKDNYFAFIVNDITNDKTTIASKPEIEKAGLAKIHSAIKASGILTFYDAKTKKTLGQVTVANSEEEVIATMTKVRELASK
jgi:hypothetical protein